MIGPVSQALAPVASQLILPAAVPDFASLFQPMTAAMAAVAPQPSGADPLTIPADDDTPVADPVASIALPTAIVVPTPTPTPTRPTKPDNFAVRPSQTAEVVGPERPERSAELQDRVNEASESDVAVEVYPVLLFQPAPLTPPLAATPRDGGSVSKPGVGPSDGGELLVAQASGALASAALPADTPVAAKSPVAAVEARTGNDSGDTTKIVAPPSMNAPAANLKPKLPQQDHDGDEGPMPPSIAANPAPADASIMVEQTVKAPRPEPAQPRLPIAMMEPEARKPRATADAAPVQISAPPADPSLSAIVVPQHPETPMWQPDRAPAPGPSQLAGTRYLPPEPVDVSSKFMVATAALGAVSAEVVQSRQPSGAERLHVHFAVDQPATAALFVATASDLDRALSTAGVRVDAVSVELRDDRRDPSSSVPGNSGAGGDAQDPGTPRREPAPRFAVPVVQPRSNGDPTLPSVRRRDRFA